MRRSIAQMVVIGVIASILGIALGLVIDWFPKQGSTQAESIDTLWDVMLVVSVPIFVLVTTVILFSVWKFHMRPGEELKDGPPIHGNTKLEIVWTAIPAVLLVALVSYAYVVLTDIEKKQSNEMVVNVTGQQFAWTFEYPGTAGGKPVVSNQLYLPAGGHVQFKVKSVDVIHSFWVPQFRMKVDAVPGLTTSYRVTTKGTGDYTVICAELCGLGHSTMRQSAHVLTAAKFTSWMAKKRQEAASTS